MAETSDIDDLLDRNKYVTVSRLEISQILHALEREAMMVTASLGGDKFFLTSVLEVDEDEDYVVIEGGKHNPHTARILDGHTLSCTTNLDKIKIRFQLESVAQATYDGHDAFMAPLPRELMRLQRREYYRMSTPVTSPIKCSISRLENDTPVAIELNLLDISCGGIAVMTAPERFAPELGAHYECVIKLPGMEPLKAKVQARSAFMMTLVNNKTCQRSGFGFIDLPERSLALIQRYLMQLERERKARLG